MKKFIKNTVIAMLVICFILNIVNLIFLVFQEYIVTFQMSEVAKEMSSKELTNEETYQLLAEFYVAGQGGKLLIQNWILGLSLIYGIIIGIMVTFEKKSKTKILLGYILGMILISIILTLFDMTQDMNFFSEFLYNIESLWKWYTLIFVITYVVKIYISNKDTQKLNEFLKNKKSKDIE